MLDWVGLLSLAFDMVLCWTCRHRYRVSLIDLAARTRNRFPASALTTVFGRKVPGSRTDLSKAGIFQPAADGTASRVEASGDPKLLPQA
jgi:hypothetical protein